MAQIADIRDKFSSLVALVTGINTYKFDVLSSMNASRSKAYPVFLLKVPATAQNVDTRKDWTRYNIDFYVLDLHPQSDTRDLADVYDEMRGYAEEVLLRLKLNQEDYVLADRTVSYEYGYDMYNDKLCGVKCSFQLSVFHCYTLPSTGDVYLLIDETNFLLIDETNKLILQ